MSTSYTTLLGFALPTTGELSGTWGTTVNNSITQLEEDAIAGYATASVTSGNWTLSTTGGGATNEARKAILIPTGTPGVSRNIIAPSSSKAYIVINQSDAAVVVKGSSTTGATVAAGTQALVAWTGTDFAIISENLSNASGTLSYSHGGTGLTAAPTNGQLPIGNGSGYTLATITAGSGVTVTNSSGGITIAATGSGGTVTSVSGTSPVSVATGTTTPVISLSSAYGDTQNPYGSKTAKYVLAAPNASSGTPSFRALVASDIPTLNQNTTGSAGSVTNSLTAGTGISYSSGSTYNGSAAITINNSAPMTYPSGSGIAVVSGGTSWTTTLTAPSGTIVGTTDTQTLTNKRISPRVVTDAGTSGTLTPTGDTADQYQMLGLTGTTTIAAPSGTPTAGQQLKLRIKDNGTGRTLNWTTTSGGYRVIGTTLPTTTVASKNIYVGCIWNATDTYWDVVAVAQEA